MPQNPLGNSHCLPLRANYPVKSRFYRMKILTLKEKGNLITAGVGKSIAEMNKKRTQFQKERVFIHTGSFNMFLDRCAISELIFLRKEVKEVSL